MEKRNIQHLKMLHEGLHKTLDRPSHILAFACLSILDLWHST